MGNKLDFIHLALSEQCPEDGEDERRLETLLIKHIKLFFHHLIILFDWSKSSIEKYISSTNRGRNFHSTNPEVYHIYIYVPVQCSIYDIINS